MTSLQSAILTAEGTAALRFEPVDGVADDDHAAPNDGARRSDRTYRDQEVRSLAPARR
jgi:hypothetical protein